ncbi:alpha/beta hydrolase [Desulfovibrio sp. TomC]|uniref:alpha/beta hydrolase n=1 Tax=Desulfovibrio sp. TomC TaxID=1562888 RepID=UPI0005732C05|nr:alpha/beta hydrolase [Desulfovibrio sp. TomC]KHK00536.1 Bem46 protein [Desulfovibrio sp. TomC]
MKYVTIACIAAMLAYCGYLTMLYVGQDRMVFPGRAANPGRVDEIKHYYPRLEPFDLPAADGTMLRGYYLPRQRDGRLQPAVLYFSGNAEEQTGFFLWSPNELRAYTVAGVDYRGYGGSDGKPSEALVKADALAVYDALMQKLGPDGRIVVMGRSLGSGVAAFVAANRPVAGVILVTPYDSLAAVGQAAHPLAPVRLLMKHPFDTAPDAARITAPSLFLVAGDDRLIPPVHAERLSALWPGPKTYEVIAAATHNNIIDNPQYWNIIREFLKGCLG